ncbi:MAG: hypothetical protein RLZZ241_1405, partial [Bacteroidota bacterium]
MNLKFGYLISKVVSGFTRKLILLGVFLFQSVLLTAQSISISDVTLAEGDSGTTTFGFTISAEIGSTACDVSNITTSDFIGYWAFCNDTNDLSATANNGGAANLTYVADPDGNLASAVSFNGTDSSIDIPYNSDYSALAGDFTFGFWIKNELSLGHAGAHILHRSNGEFTVSLDGNNQLLLNNQATSTILTSSTVFANEWTKVFITRSGNVFSLYVNDNLDNSATNTVTFGNDTSLLRIGYADAGGNGGSYRFQGGLDNLVLFNRALTVTEMQGFVANPALGDITFEINTADGTATAGIDYTAISSGIGTITSGNTSTTLDVTVSGDTLVEADETFSVVISNTSLGTITDNTGVGTITNDDSVVVEFSAGTGSDAEGTGGNLPTLFVTGTVTAATTVTVSDLGTGSAISGTDYVFTSPQVITIPAGLYDGTVATAIAIPTLSITDDAAIELDETIELELSLPTGDASLGAVTTTTYTITNDDSVVVEFSAGTGSDSEGTGGNLPTLFVTGTVSATTTVTVSDLGTGSAISGTDYLFTSPQVITIPAGIYDGTALTAIAIPTLSITD